MIKKLIQKYRDWKDRRFLAQLERVFSRNVVKSNVYISGSVLIGDCVYMYVKENLKDLNIEELRKKGYIV